MITTGDLFSLFLRNRSCNTLSRHYEYVLESWRESLKTLTTPVSRIFKKCKRVDGKLKKKSLALVWNSFLFSNLERKLSYIDSM